MIAEKYGRDNALPPSNLESRTRARLRRVPGAIVAAYVNSVSWSGATKPLPHEANPQLVFEHLFGDGSSPQERSARKQAKASLSMRSCMR